MQVNFQFEKGLKMKLELRNVVVKLKDEVCVVTTTFGEKRVHRDTANYYSEVEYKRIIDYPIGFVDHEVHKWDRLPEEMRKSANPS